MCRGVSLCNRLSSWARRSAAWKPCPKGHSFTAPILGELQHEKAEDAIWAAVRALQEKEQLFASLAAKATAWLHPGTANEYLQKARQAREQADLPKRVLLA